MTSTGEREASHCRSTLVWLHGWGRPPADYRLAERLRERYGCRLLAPFLYGNHSRVPRLLTIEEYVEATRSFLAEHLSAGEEYVVAGHSTGAMMALCSASASSPPAGVLALNPLLPTAYSWAGFLHRSSRMNLKHVLGISGWPGSHGLLLRTGGRFLLNGVKGLDTLRVNLRALTEFRLEEVARHVQGQVSAPVEVVFGRGDEFFRLPEELVPLLQETFPAIELRVLEQTRSHEWCLVDEGLGLEEAARFLEQRVGWPAPR